MPTNDELNIVAYLVRKKTITWKEIDAVPVNIYSFLEIMGRLKYQGLIKTGERTFKRSGVPDIKANIYSLTDQGKRYYSRNFPELEQQISKVPA